MYILCQLIWLIIDIAERGVKLVECSQMVLLRDYEGLITILLRNSGFFLCIPYSAILLFTGELILHKFR